MEPPGFLASVAWALAGGVCWCCLWDIAMSGGREIRRGWSMESTGNVGEGKLQLLLPISARDETDILFYCA